MKLFATRVWGFDPVKWPAVTFGLDGNRDNLLRNSTVGDAVVFVGTQGQPTQEKERGRLLGIAQFGRHPVEPLDVLKNADIAPDNFDERGNFKWPKALLMTRAWRFSDDPPPKLVDVLEAQLPYNATAQAVELSEADTNAVRALAADEIPLPDTPELTKLRRLETALSRDKPTTGVIPTAWKTTVERTVGNASVTYAFRFGAHNCWKIGHTTDIVQRLKDVNKHIPTEVLKCEWKPYLQQDWPNEKMAYAMEQRVLNALSASRTVGERVECTQQVLDSSWIKSITE